DFLNRKAYDTLFCIRSKIETIEQPEAPVVMVDVDDTTLEEMDFQIPIALWHEYFGVVIEALAESQAKVIGLDYLLPGVLFDDKIKDYSQVWRRAFILAQSYGTRVVTGFIQKEDRQIIPHKKYVLAIDAQNLGFFNLTLDGDDDVVRQQRLVVPTKNGKSLHSFGYRLFHAFDPDYRLSSEEIYIDFLPQNNFFPRYSFSDVYRKVKEGDVFFLKQHFKNKIVIIGTVDSLSHDRYLTPLQYLSDGYNKRMPGPDIHASIVHTLYGNRFFHEISGTARFGIYLFLTLITGFVAGFLRFRHITYSLITLVLIAFSVSVFSFLNFLILPIAPCMAAIGLNLMFSLSYRNVVLDREKRRIYRLFETFLTPQVAHGVLKLKNTELLKGKKMRLCILFSDIRGFTTFSKASDDLEVVERLNEYYAPMSDAVSDEGGVVSRFFGDGMLAFFGAFEETENPSLAGIKSALNMVKQLKGLNHDWQMAGKEPFKIGIGLHTGEVALGGIGSAKRIEFTLTGDAANLASRVESKTKELKETILISEDLYMDVYDQLPDTVRFEDKGVQAVKGRPPVRLYALKINE
ncbi:adenylate/guanylate cyclase domain-containing protein, partial [Desulfobacterales bacterium HSG16]|nr:adenylate/guanylate cyclase domain-containing protein [Desulfobacterales bacterium HSG16]